MTDPGFPWGSNNPTRPQRVIVAACIATGAVLILAREYARDPAFHSDFGLAWFGASALLHGSDPYLGPGAAFNWGRPFLYPGTALVAAIPFAALSEKAASMTFLWISAFLLGYGVTTGSWHRLPMFVTEAFASSARLAQWSMLLTAAVFIPWLALFTAVKPQAGLPVLAGSSSRVAIRAAVIGGVVLVIVSLILLPSWPGEWWTAMRAAERFTPHIMRLGGPLVLLVLLRWRRWEAWLVLTLACMPQTWGWYNVLMLLTIPATYREAVVLALLSAGGAILTGFIVDPNTAESFEKGIGAVQVATAFLPATLVVLRRPNDGATPVWLERIIRRVRPSAARITG